MDGNLENMLNYLLGKREKCTCLQQNEIHMVEYKLHMQQRIYHPFPAINSQLSSCLLGGLLHNGKQCVTYTLETEIHTF